MMLDQIDSLHMAESLVPVHGNELNSLNYLATGLEFLYTGVKRIEDHVLERLMPGNEYFVFGQISGVDRSTLGLVACTFHWYAVSACNYVRMVGWLVHGGNPKKATEYVQRVLPAVYVWRNKVGAHFARTAPTRGDTPADLAMSVLFPITFDGDAFFAGSLVLGMGSPGQTSTSRLDMRWSLTHTHHALRARYPILRSGVFLDT